MNKIGFVFNGMGRESEDSRLLQVSGEFAMTKRGFGYEFE
jgi:hypothetical protein